MKFNYKKLASGILRPIIPIEVGYKDERTKYFALIDSGADISLFDAEVGESIGIDITSGEKSLIGGITEGESQPYYIHSVKITIGGWEYKTKVGFMPTLSKLGHGLLGQRGFFDLFKGVKFEFDGTRGEIELRRK